VRHSETLKNTNGQTRRLLGLCRLCRQHADDNNIITRVRSIMPTQRGRKTILASFGRTSDKTWKDEKNDESRIKHSSAIGELKPERSAVAVAKRNTQTLLNAFRRLLPLSAVFCRTPFDCTSFSPVFRQSFSGRKTSFADERRLLSVFRRLSRLLIN